MGLKNGIVATKLGPTVSRFSSEAGLLKQHNWTTFVSGTVNESFVLNRFNARQKAIISTLFSFSLAVCAGTPRESYCLFIFPFSLSIEMKMVGLTKGWINRGRSSIESG
jgi:hypothetical protein